MTSGFSNTASYLCYGCVDLVHDARTLAYHRHACENGLYQTDPQIIVQYECYCPADGLPSDFTDPATDEVCWYDPLIPESAEFLGILISDASGLIDSPYTRELVPAVANRSALQVPSKPGRQIVFDIVILATTCAGMEYGMNWLQRVLERNACRSGRSCSSCSGQRLQVRVNCDEGSSGSGLRTFYSAGVLTGLQLDEDQLDDKCCQIKTGQVVFGTELHRSFDETIIECSFDADPEAFVACIDWDSHCIECETEPCVSCRNCNQQQEVCEGCAAKCGPCSRCYGDPLCDTSLRIIRPTLPVNECFCEPIEKLIQCCDVGDLPNGMDTAVSIEVYSGFDLDDADYGLRNMRIKVYPNPLDLPEPTDDASWDLWKLRKPCSSLEISYIPPDSTLLIDGRLQQVFLTCEGVCKPFNHAAASALGGSIFPLISSCTSLLVCVEWDFNNTAVVTEAGRKRPASLTVLSNRAYE